MRRFYVYSFHWPEELKTIWEESWFITIDNPAKSGDQPPDCIVSFGNLSDEAAFWDQAVTHRFKTAVIADKVFRPLPEKVKEIYEQQFIQGEGLCFTLATRLEGKFPMPVWEMFQSENGIPDELQHKVIADLIYRYLLKELMQETFEWCGHTFSVLGPG